jgi:glutathione S-transferase
MWLYGWEDFDLWCKFVEQDFQGVLVPEILARYRVHPKSLLQAHTKSRARSVTEEILERHPWLTIDLEAIT